MAFESGKGHAALRRGRFSQALAEYFLTLCTDTKRPGLTAATIAQAILREAHAMSGDGTWTLLSVVIMPDHVHLMAVLGERISLGKVVQRLKAKTSAALRSGGIAWERGFFDRQFRPKDDRLAVYRYIYLNPYRAGLLPTTERWPYYFCRDQEWEWFRDHLHEDRPYPEWLL